jgi:hypothetical protein
MNSIWLAVYTLGFEIGFHVLRKETISVTPTRQRYAGYSKLKCRGSLAKLTVLSSFNVSLCPL